MAVKKIKKIFLNHKWANYYSLFTAAFSSHVTFTNAYQLSKPFLKALYVFVTSLSEIRFYIEMSQLRLKWNPVKCFPIVLYKRCKNTHLSVWFCRIWRKSFASVFENRLKIGLKFLWNYIFLSVGLLLCFSPVWVQYVQYVVGICSIQSVPSQYKVSERAQSCCSWIKNC